MTSDKKSSLNLANKNVEEIFTALPELTSEQQMLVHSKLKEIHATIGERNDAKRRTAAVLHAISSIAKIMGVTATL